MPINMETNQMCLEYEELSPEDQAKVSRIAGHLKVSKGHVMSYALGRQSKGLSSSFTSALDDIDAFDKAEDFDRWLKNNFNISISFAASIVDRVAAQAEAKYGTTVIPEAWLDVEAEELRV